MLVVEEKLLEIEEPNLICSLNYPVIRLLNKENNFINYINKKIYEDVLCFKEVVKKILDEESSDIYMNILTEFMITFNKNNIISIPIEFSQFLGINNISYINSYNYDIDLEKEIKLKDIFNSDIDYKSLLKNIVKIQLGTLLEDYDKSSNVDAIDLINMIYSIEIYDDQPFYLEEDGLVFCLSGYEMGSYSSSILEFKIMYEDGVDYFSDYFIREVLE